MKYRIPLLLILLALPVLLCMAFMPPHDFHVSMTELEQNRENGRLEMTIKLFTDDLEKALEMEGVERLLLGDEAESEKADHYLNAYIQKRFEVESQEESVNWTFIGKEVEMDVTWCYLESDSIAPVEELKFESHLLTDVFDDQQNIIKSRQAKSRALILSPTSNSGSILWK